MWKPDACFYHFPCDDGFASALVARRKWPDIQLFPTNYGQPMPAVDLDGMNLLIVDFSYKPDVLLELAGKASSIVILDHHKTALEDLAQFAVELCSGARFVVDDVEAMLRDYRELGHPPIIAEFDMDRSGAGMTWDFCFPDKQRPRLIDHIEDRDLWRLELPETRRLSLFLRSLPYDFDMWNGELEAFEFETDRNKILQQADGIERFYDRKIDEMVPTAVLKKIGEWDGVPVAHAPYAFASDLAHELLKKHPEAPFAAVVVDAYGGRTYSLRSEDDREDVSAVARKFGGGGHRNAAGFRMPL